MYARAVEAYHQTKKRQDILWNRFVARPAASLVVVLLEKTRVTPNQLTLSSLLLFLVSAILLVTQRSHGGLILATMVLQISYVLDCADGQLARLRKSSTPVGAYLDFLADEIKAFVLVTAVAVRLWLLTERDFFLLEGLLTLLALTTALSMTSFIRRREYIDATGEQAPPAAGDYETSAEKKDTPSPIDQAQKKYWVTNAEIVGKFIIHYPSYILILALLDRLQWFLPAYLTINAAYAARSLLNVTINLGKSQKPQNK